MIRSNLLALLLVLVALSLTGCFHLPAASIPDRTFRPGDDDRCAPGALVDPRAGAWPKREQRALREALDEGEPVVVSALGCRVDVIPRCTTSGNIEARREGDATTFARGGGGYRALDLRGACPFATHVVDEATFDARGRLVDVSIRELTLEGFDLGGVWRGVLRQPGGPYARYDLRLDLSRRGDLVRGTSEVATVDGDQWGLLRLRGSLRGTTVYFADRGVIDQDISPFLAWCMKGGYAVIDPRAGALRGAWRALACVPGTIEADRVDE